MTPAARDPECRGAAARLSPADVEFALRALLGAAASGAAAREAAARLPPGPTLAEVVAAAWRHRGPRARRAALRLLDAYFRLDPAVPSSGDAAS